MFARSCRRRSAGTTCVATAWDTASKTPLSTRIAKPTTSRISTSPAVDRSRPGGVSNPTLTGVALALRAARRITERASSNEAGAEVRELVAASH